MLETNPIFYVASSVAFVGLPWETAAERIEPINRGEAPRCPACKAFTGMLPWLPPYRVRLQVHGEEVGDCVLVSSGWLVSQRFTDIVQRERFCGLEFAPVEIVNPKRSGLLHRTPFYYLKVAAGRAAIDVQASEMEIGPVTCTECRGLRSLKRWKRLILEAGTWDGLDAFTARGLPGTIWFTDRLRNALMNANLKLFPLLRADEYAWDHDLPLL